MAANSFPIGGYDTVFLYDLEKYPGSIHSSTVKVSNRRIFFTNYTDSFYLSYHRKILRRPIGTPTS